MENSTLCTICFGPNLCRGLIYCSPLNCLCIPSASLGITMVSFSQFFSVLNLDSKVETVIFSCFVSALLALTSSFRSLTCSTGESKTSNLLSFWRCCIFLQWVILCSVPFIIRLELSFCCSFTFFICCQCSMALFPAAAGSVTLRTSCRQRCSNLELAAPRCCRGAANVTPWWGKYTMAKTGPGRKKLVNIWTHFKYNAAERKSEFMVTLLLR